jgi:hypothetical protein
VRALATALSVRAPSLCPDTETLPSVATKTLTFRAPTFAEKVRLTLRSTFVTTKTVTEVRVAGPAPRLKEKSGRLTEAVHSPDPLQARQMSPVTESKGGSPLGRFESSMAILP